MIILHNLQIFLEDRCYYVSAELMNVEGCSL